MHSLNSIVVLERLLERASASAHSLTAWWEDSSYQKRLFPIVLEDGSHVVDIPPYESIVGGKVARVRYEARYFSVFHWTTEYLGQEGRGTYGIGLYRKGSAGWHCISVLFSETTHEPLLVEQRDAAVQVAGNEARQRDKRAARANEDAILAHGLMEAPVLNALLGALMRAAPETICAFIGVRGSKVQLLLDDDAANGRSLRVPRDGFVCRDEAAGMVLQEIAYALDDAGRADRRRAA